MAEGSRIREKVRDDQATLDIYSNRLVTVASDGAVVMITMGCARPISERLNEAPAGEPVATVNNRLALPYATVVDLHRALGGMIELWQQRVTAATPVNAPSKKDRN